MQFVRKFCDPSQQSEDAAALHMQVGRIQLLGGAKTL